MKHENIRIRPLSEISLDTIFAAWEDAFAGYARTWTRQEFENDMRRRGFTPDLSFGAFDGGRLVSFTLNGIGNFDGMRTAYDTGTGTIKDYRGLGLAGRIFDESVPHLRQAGIEQYLLEVLQTNTTAINIYTNSGFSIRRELNYFVQNTNDIVTIKRSLLAEYKIRQTYLDQILTTTEMWDFAPSWQNSMDAIGRCPKDFIVQGAFYDNELVGYGLMAPSSGDVTQLAVHKAHRRQGIGSCILHELLRHNASNQVKVINTDKSCAAMTVFLENNGIPKAGAQFEMTRKLK